MMFFCVLYHSVSFSPFLSGLLYYIKTKPPEWNLLSIQSFSSIGNHKVITWLFFTDKAISISEFVEMSNNVICLLSLQSDRINKKKVLLSFLCWLVAYRFSSFFFVYCCWYFVGYKTNKKKRQYQQISSADWILSCSDSILIFFDDSCTTYTTSSASSNKTDLEEIGLSSMGHRVDEYVPFDQVVHNDWR